MAARIRIPTPKAKGSQTLSLFPRVPKFSFKKSALQDDPSKFGNAGFDINMQGPPLLGGKK